MLFYEVLQALFDTDFYRLLFINKKQVDHKYLSGQSACLAPYKQNSHVGSY